MKIACVDALAGLARAPPPEAVAAAYGLDELRLRPGLSDPQAVRPAPDRRAAGGGGQGGDGHRRGHRGRSPDLAAYRQRLGSGSIKLRPDDEADLRGRARQPQRLVYADGEEERVLRAVQVVVEEGLAKPILIGRPEVIEAPGRAPGPAPCAPGQRLRAGQPGQRPALQRLCGLLPGPRSAARASRRRRAREHAAHPPHGDRRRHAGARRGRRHAGRPGRPVRYPSARRSAPCSGSARRCSEASTVHAPGAGRRRPVHRRHQRQLRSERRR